MVQKKQLRTEGSSWLRAKVHIFISKLEKTETSKLDKLYDNYLQQTSNDNGHAGSAKQCHSSSPSNINQ
uniref:Uncharacterized protein n=1 Tax=Anguilla anguilla TaxID=7936 RepID=A0A0E9XM25_ANGAN